MNLFNQLQYKCICGLFSLLVKVWMFLTSILLIDCSWNWHSFSKYPIKNKVTQSERNLSGSWSSNIILDPRVESTGEEAQSLTSMLWKIIYWPKSRWFSLCVCFLTSWRYFMAKSVVVVHVMYSMTAQTWYLVEIFFLYFLP